MSISGKTAGGPTTFSGWVPLGTRWMRHVRPISILLSMKMEPAWRVRLVATQPSR